MIICEHEFNNEDNKHLGYSFAEIDFFSWIPHKFHEQCGNYRLTLWKNLKTNKFELIKVFMQQSVKTFQMNQNTGVLITNTETGEQIEVVLSNESLEPILTEAHELWNKFHGSHDYKREIDTICTHTGLEPYCFKK